MSSIKYKMLVSFGSIALVSIFLIGGVVSWRMNRSILEQTASFAVSMRERVNENLRYPHQTASTWMREPVRYNANNLRYNPDLIENLETQRPLALAAILETVAATEGIDVALLFNLKGELQASFPLGMNALEVESYLATVYLWRHAQQVLQGEIAENTRLWDDITVFDAGLLRMLRLEKKPGESDKALSLLSAAVIENDFGDPVGFALVGKLLNNHHELLQQLTEMTGFASAIYFEQLPIVQAGFGSVVEPEMLKIPADVYTDVYNGDSAGTEYHFTLAGAPYLTICSSLTSFNGDKQGILCTGIPETRITDLQNQILTQGLATKNSLQQWILGIGLLSLALFAGISLVISTRIVSPLRHLSGVAQKVALGDIQQQIRVTSRDEIGDLSRSLWMMVASFQDIAAKSQAIAQGELDHHITPRSDQDVLGQSLRQMSAYLAETAAAIAEGDLTTTPSVRSEADVFGRTMHLMTQGLHSLIRQITTGIGHIASIGAMFTSLTEQDTQLAKEVQNSLDHTISTMMEMSASVEQVAQNMDSLLTFVQQTSSAIAEMTTSIATVAANTTKLSVETEQMNGLVGESMQAVEQITQQTDASQRLSQETAQDALEGQRAVTQIRESMDRIQQMNTHTVDTVTHFAETSGEIGTILDVIRSINEQSSLLALNASIIAAQAGSHGRGFSVIADEMRNLSNEVEASTKNIAALIHTIKQETNGMVQMIANGTAEIDEGVERTQQAEQRLQKILFSAKQSSSVVHDIAEALHAQVATNHNVIKATNHVSSMTTEMMKATGEQKVSMNQIHEAMEHIYAMASQTQQATGEQLDGVQQVIDAANNVGALTDQNVQSSQRINRTVCDELAPQAQQLLQAVERFKLPVEERGQGSYSQHMYNDLIVQSTALNNIRDNVRKEKSDENESCNGGNDSNGIRMRSGVRIPGVSGNHRTGRN